MTRRHSELLQTLLSRTPTSPRIHLACWRLLNFGEHRQHHDDHLVVTSELLTFARRLAAPRIPLLSSGDTWAVFAVSLALLLPCPVERPDHVLLQSVSKLCIVELIDRNSIWPQSGGVRAIPCPLPPGPATDFGPWLYSVFHQSPTYHDRESDGLLAVPRGCVASGRSNGGWNARTSRAYLLLTKFEKIPRNFQSLSPQKDPHFLARGPYLYLRECPFQRLRPFFFFLLYYCY
ncbi:hypothetical protein VNO77_23056 [Canavalia gladiata]|uniref:Uncharacterized protein n=1 Tax=Canavalia gladiata TaxID=3824 RepID=A0AAN9L4B6_CANGL